MLGCEGYRDGVRGAGRSMGLVDLRDYRSAKASGQALPGYLGLPPERIEVAPDSGRSLAIISGVTTDAEAQRLTAAVAEYNAANPQLDPVELRSR